MTVVENAGRSAWWRNQDHQESPARRVAQGREARAAKAKLEAKAAAARAGAMIDDTADVVFLAAPRPNGPR
jgi:hypothetical protein